MRFGDEVGLLWDEPPVIKPARGKKNDFNANVGVLENYRPPSSYIDFAQRDRIALDIETKDPDLRNKGPSMYRGGGKIVGVALATGYDEASYYPTAHANVDRCVANPEQFYNNLRAQAAEFKGEIVTANGMYDLDWLQAEQGIHFPNARLRDVQIAEGLLDENRFTYRLDKLGEEYLGEGKATDVLSGLYGKGYIENMDRVDPGHAGLYAERDASMTLEILDLQKPSLETDGLSKLFDLESDLAPLLLNMRRVGVRVDVDKAEQVLAQIEEFTVAGRQKLHEIAGMPVDVNAGATIARACDALSIKYPRTKPTKNYPDGQPSFRKDWLEAHSHPLMQMITEQRGYEKIGGTFVKNYILEGHTNGRLHCQFHQLKGDGAGARTGRFSSSGPNLQNIPTRHKVLGPLLRSMFIPEDGMDWGGADWSQIEYRLLVHYASITPGVDVSQALRMYRDDPRTDFHALAAEISGKSRSVAKNINFGVMYGMGVLKMANSLGVSFNEGKAILQEFHTKSPFLKEMLNTASSRAAARGHIKTMMGRRRRFPQWEYDGTIYGSEAAARAIAAERPGRGFPRVAMTHKALNALLQGSAADLMKIAMVQMWKAGIFNVLIPHLTVHDEMNVSVPRTKEGEQAFDEMCHIMENCVKLAVPVLVDAKRGLNWSETK